MLTKEQTEKAEAFYKANPDCGRKAIAKLVSCSEFAAKKFLDAVRAGKPAPTGGTRYNLHSAPKAAKAVGGAKACVVPVKDFVARFDYEAKLRATLAELCGDCFVAEVDIRSACEIPIPVFRTVAELPEFRACQIKDGGVIWWSTRKNADAARANAKRWGITK